jgi:uncharacterized membrane protein YphA (DoxX/SURF4 family)
MLLMKANLPLVLYVFMLVKCIFSLNMIASVCLQIGDTSSTGAGADTSYGSCFILGFIAGCVSFGGAYTTLPFIYSIAVTQAGYLTNQQFLDSLAICNMLPTPLVSFVVTVSCDIHSSYMSCMYT